MNSEEMKPVTVDDAEAAKAKEALGIENDEPIEDIEVIHPRDKGKPFSVAQFKRWRGGLMKNMNSVLQEFQKGIVGGQARISLAWNAMNAVIRALVKKGLITEEDIKEAGAELWQEMQHNVKTAKAASEAGTMPVGLIRTPIEKARDDVNQAVHEITKKDEKNQA